MFNLQTFRKADCHRIFAMNHKNLVRLFLKRAYPFDKSVLIGMPAQPLHCQYLSSHLYSLSKELNLLRTFNYRTS